jgi:hypothetical protein
MRRGRGGEGTRDRRGVKTSGKGATDPVLVLETAVVTDGVGVGGLNGGEGAGEDAVVEAGGGGTSEGRGAGGLREEGASC